LIFFSLIQTIAPSFSVEPATTIVLFKKVSSKKPELF
jgi:hypothetical protein